MAAAPAPIREAGSQRTPVGGYPLSSISVTPVGTVAVPLPLNSGARAVRAGSSSAKAAVRVPHFHYPRAVSEPPEIHEIGPQRA